MMTRKIIQAFAIFIISLGLVALTATPRSAQAQSTASDYTLNVHRNVGFSSGSQIRGSFSAEVIGPANIKSVTFLIDGKPMSQVSQSPFRINFNTGDYPTGWHDLTATVLTSDGQTVTTQARRFEFATPDQESAVFKNTVLPLIGGILGVVVLVIGGQFLLMRNRPLSTLPLGTPRKYGLRGGAICPRCHRPFPVHWWAMNLGIGSKFDRCDFCGRSGMFRLVGHDALVKAEAAELEMAGPGATTPPEDEAGKLKKMLDESRYTEK